MVCFVLTLTRSQVTTIIWYWLDSSLPAGVSTGFGGSADTRTDSPLVLGHALLQMQHAGVLPSSTKVLNALPLLDPMGSVMPEAWVRGAMLVRMNSLIRGHSGVRWELIERMNRVLSANITPVVPLRGSISASGGAVSTISYHKEYTDLWIMKIFPLFHTLQVRSWSPARAWSVLIFEWWRDALWQPINTSFRRTFRIWIQAHDFESGGSCPSWYRTSSISFKGTCKSCLIQYASWSSDSRLKLGILNGTAFSAAVASLALHDAVKLTLLSHVLTAIGVEALNGTRASFHPFIHDVARPHPGQIESAKLVWDLLENSQFAVLQEEEVTIEQDEGKSKIALSWDSCHWMLCRHSSTRPLLSSDRSSIFGAPDRRPSIVVHDGNEGMQFEWVKLWNLGWSSFLISSTATDNPLIDGTNGHVHHGGNFQVG